MKIFFLIRLISLRKGLGNHWKSCLFWHWADFMSFWRKNMLKDEFMYKFLQKLKYFFSILIWFKNFPHTFPEKFPKNLLKPIKIFPLKWNRFHSKNIRRRKMIDHEIYWFTTTKKSNLNRFWEDKFFLGLKRSGSSENTISRFFFTSWMKYKKIWR